VATAKERGIPIIAGDVGGVLASGLGEIVCLPGEAYGAEVARDPELASQCAADVERRGYARDLCGYMRMFWGSMFLNRTPWGKFPKPDLIVRQHLCDTHAEWFRVVADHFGIPYFIIDHPRRSPSLEEREHHIEYQVAQYLELIEWLEKQLGREYDDEKLIEAVISQRRCGALYAQVCLLNQTVPAPVDMKSLYAFGPAAIGDTSPRKVAFYEALRDEVQERAAQGIAAVPNERCRLYHDNIPPWYALHIFRYMEAFGAVCVASHYQFGFGAWGFDEERRWLPLEPDLNPKPRNRQEAIRAMLLPMENGRLQQNTSDARREILRQIVENWHIDGGVFHLNRGCEGQSLGRMEMKLLLQRETGLPTVVYESSSCDRADFNEAQVLGRLEAFLRGLGLRRTEA